MPLFDANTWPFSIDWLPDEAYLVGGSVRDRLLKRTPTYLDLDFVLPDNTLQIASDIAVAHKAGFVVLDAKRQIARITFEQMTVDFAQRQGESAAEDLGKRDFTVNAIAYSPHTHSLIDPLNGQADLAARKLRMIRRENLAADPIRLLRGHRQSAQLGFELCPETEAAIASLSSRLILVAIERIRKELDALLSTPAGTQQLGRILRGQLLSFHLPNFNVRSVERAIAIDRAFAQLEQAMPSYAQQMKSWLKPVPLGGYQSWIKAAKLSQIIAADPAEARYELENLRFSRSEAQVVLAVLGAQGEITALKDGELTRSQQFFLFKNVGQSFRAFSLLALAEGVDLTQLKPLIKKFQDPANEIAHPETLISGTVLIKQLGIQPGPNLGALLSAVEHAQAAGKLSSAAEAIAFVKALCQSEPHQKK